jgi:hypothetical protein
MALPTQAVQKIHDHCDSTDIVHFRRRHRTAAVVIGVCGREIGIEQENLDIAVDDIPNGPNDERVPLIHLPQLRGKC